MDSVDLEVLKRSVDWLRAGHRVVLATVVETWGSSPRPAGALLAIRDDGLVSGSVSGGCVEDDLIERIRNHTASDHNPPSRIFHPARSFMGFDEQGRPMAAMDGESRRDIL